MSQDYPGVTTLDNKLYTVMSTTHRTTPIFDITSNGVSQIAASLLGGHPPFSGKYSKENRHYIMFYHIGDHKLLGAIYFGASLYWFAKV